MNFGNAKAWHIGVFALILLLISIVCFSTTSWIVGISFLLIAGIFLLIAGFKWIHYEKYKKYIQENDEFQRQTFTVMVS